MKASALFKEYVWLVGTISWAGRITLREINERWLRTEMSEGVEFSRTTFRRHRAEVEEMFGIIIDCDSENRYYINDTEMFREESVQKWMLSTLTVSNIVSEARGLHDRILLESIPSESEHLQTVVEAMRENCCLSIRYRRYGKTESSQWTVEPYCIKLFRRRWYLLGRLDDGAFLTLSFDRIQEMTMTDRTFVLDKDFDAQSYFSAYYGIMQGGDEPKQQIVLRAYGNERYAMRDLPLHHSQKELGVGDDYVDFEVKLHPTSDFLAQILSRGRWLKVLEPEDIALRIKQMHSEAAED
jgi:hypothetical protein